MSGRYINADDLWKKITSTCEKSFIGLDELCNLIDNQPTADVSPAVHAHWIPVPVSSGRDSWKCSVCGRRARGKRENLPYCHCGAKMDEQSLSPSDGDTAYGGLESAT